MGALHLVNRGAALVNCLRVATADDAILLLEDGVYAAVAGLAPARPMHALEVDVLARGLEHRLAPSVSLASDEAFVTLVEAHQPIVTWRS
jgi:tRNA 2-thiouridine synthesizing protein B